MTKTIQPEGIKGLDADYWSKEALPLLSPFRFKGVTTEEAVSKAGGKYNKYIVTLSPLAIPHKELKISLFKSEWDKIRALLFLDYTDINISYDEPNKRLIYNPVIKS